MTNAAKVAKRELAAQGISLTVNDGEYRVNYKGGLEKTAYYTTDLEDAITTAKIMTPPKNP